MKRLLILLLLLTTIKSSSQGVKIQLFRDNSLDSNIYILKIYNDTSCFIGIKSSVSFRYFSEDSILSLAMGNWFRSNDARSFYDIDCSQEDAQFSDIYSYQLILLAPQTYLILKVNLIDYGEFDKARFRVSYKPIITERELLLYAQRQPGKVLMSNARIPFESRIIDIQK